MAACNKAFIMQLHCKAQSDGLPTLLLLGIWITLFGGICVKEMKMLMGIQIPTQLTYDGYVDSFVEVGIHFPITLGMYFYFK